MPVQWQTVDLPLGQGMDDNSAKPALPPGRPVLLTNCQFQKSGAFPKRYGFDQQLGASSLGSSGRLLSLDTHLVGVAGGKLYDYAKPNTGATVVGAQGSFMSRGAFRAVPTSARIVKNSSSNITACDAYSVQGFTMLAWTDGSLLYTEIIDDTTGAIVGTQNFASSSFGNTAFGPGFQVSGYLSSDLTTIHFYLTFAGYIVHASGNGNDSWSWSSVVHPVAGTYKSSRIAIDATNAIVYFGAFTSDGTTVLAATLSSALTLTHSGTHTDANVDTNCPIAICVAQSTIYIGYRSSGGALVAALFSLTAVYSSATSIITAAEFSHLTIASNGTLVTAIYDVLSTVGTYQSTILRCDISGGSASGVVFRGASLISDAIYVNGICYFEALYYSYVQASVPSAIASGANLQDGTSLTTEQVSNLKIPSLNSAAFVVTLDGQICARVLRESAMQMLAIGSTSKTLTGLLFPARAISQTDGSTLGEQLSLGAAALVRFDLSNEKARGIGAYKNLIGAGGSPMAFDGTTPTELGFHVYPEVIKAVSPNADGSIAGATSGLAANRSTAFAAGAIANQDSLDSGTQAIYDSNLWMCVAGGTTGGSVPAGYFTNAAGAFVQDGTSWWQNLGPRPPLSYASDLLVAPGATFVPTVPNGLFYVVTSMTATGHHTPGVEPTWPTVVGNSVTVSDFEGTGSIVFTCAGSTRAQLSGGHAYGLAACYASVDDRGLLHRSALSPMAAMVLTASTNGHTANPIWAFSALRLTGKTNARIEVYRTSADGTTLQQIATLANNPSVDLISFIDSTDDTTQQLGAVCYQGPLGAGEFNNEPPPSCSSIAANRGRLACNSLEDTTGLYLSKLAVDGLGIAWTSALRIPTDGTRGPLNAVAAMDGNWILFHDASIGVISGDGPDNTGQGVAYALPQYLATDVGCANPDSIVLTPQGLVFQSSKGVYLLGRDLTTQFIGEFVQQDLTGTIVSSAIDPTTHQAIFVTDAASSSNTFVWDFKRNTWAIWSISGTGVPASVVAWNNKPVICDSLGAVWEQSGSSYIDPSGTPCAWAVEIAPVRVAGAQGYESVRAVNLQFKSSGSPKITLGVKENDSESVAYSFAEQALASGHDSFQALLRNIRLTSIGLVITETTPGSDLMLEGISFQLGLRGGLARKGGNRRVG